VNDRHRRRLTGLALGGALTRIDALEREVRDGRARERNLGERVDSLSGSLTKAWREIEGLRSLRFGSFVRTPDEKGASARSPGLPRVLVRPLPAPTARDPGERKRVPAAAAAERLGLAAQTIRRLVAAGELEGLAVPMPDSGRRVWTVTLDSLERFERAAADAVGAPGAREGAVTGLRRR